MDRLPTTRHLWVLVLLLSLGGWFEIYDLIFTGYIAPGLAKSGLLSTTTETFFGLKGIAGFIAATFSGLFVGTFFLGFLPDRYGRKLIFTFGSPEHELLNLYSKVTLKLMLMWLTKIQLRML